MSTHQGLQNGWQKVSMSLGGFELCIWSWHNALKPFQANFFYWVLNIPVDLNNLLFFIVYFVPIWL